MKAPGLSRDRSGTRRIAALVLLVTSMAVFVHHAAPAMDAMGTTEHTCVAVAAHVFDAVAAPAAIFATAFAATLAVFALTGLLRPRRRLLRARAGPLDRILPLRC